MKLAFALALLALLFAIPAHADGLDVYVTAWDSHTTTIGTPNGVVSSPIDQIFWTFETGLTGPAPTDTNPQDVAFFGYNLPFALEGMYYGPLGADGLGTATDKASAPNTHTYFAIYGDYTNDYVPDAWTTAFAGVVHLTDENGFISGLPFEQNCTSQCTNYVYPGERTDSLAELNYLNTDLVLITGSATLTVDPTPTPEPGTVVLFGVGLVGVLALTKVLG